MRFLVRIADGLNLLKDIPALFFRLVLTYGFFFPFYMKVKNIDAVAQWFGTIGIPLPTFSAWISMIFEGLGCIFLFFGFATRIITVPLMVMMWVAMAFVHWQHGFAAGNNGIEIPLYYFLMLFSLFITGPGKISIDALMVGSLRSKP